MKEQNFLKHFFIVGLGTGITMIIGLITTPIITRILSTETYGQLSLFKTYGLIFSMILCIGLDQSLVRFYYSEQDFNYKSNTIKNCVIPPLILCTIISIAILVLSANNIINFIFSTLILLNLCLYTFSLILNRFSILVIRLEYDSKLYSNLRIIEKLSYLIFTIILLNFTNYENFFLVSIGLILSVLLTSIVGIYKKRKLWKFLKSEAFFYSKNPNIIELINYGSPFIIANGIAELFVAADKLSLSYFCSYSEIGIYSAAVNLINIFAIIQQVFGTLWAPLAIEHYEKNPQDKEFYSRAFKNIVFIMFLFGISIVLVKDFFVLILGEKYREAAFIFPFLIFNPIMFTISEITVQGMLISKKSGLQIIVALISCLANFVGNFILIPIMGIKGAALSTGISYIIFFLLRTYFANMYYPIKYDLKNFSIITVLTVCFCYYNTFEKINIITFIIYLVILTIIIITYRDSVVHLYNYLKKSFSVRKNR